MYSLKLIFGLAACGVMLAAAVSGQTLPNTLQTGKVLFVDDDGAQCPGALTTIQEAVAKASPGTTILVCPGTYFKMVTISGSAKEAIRLISLGQQDEVVLVGDHTEAYGFYLLDVKNVLIRGFTIRDFGDKPTTPSQAGNGCAIHVQNSNYNTIENNRLSRTDMIGITLANSGNNTLRYNFIFEIDPKGFGNGIYLEGKKSANNFIFQNYAYSQPGGGVLVWGAGTGNVIVDNDFSNLGWAGISNQDTDGTHIEGNRFSYNSVGIQLSTSNQAIVLDNMVRGNTKFDVSWDGKGDVSFSNNACETANRAGLCGR